MIATDPSTHLFWITSRAAGSVALLTASAAVCLGLLMSTRVLARLPRIETRVAHEILSLSCMVAIAIHALSLIGDQYLRPSLLDVAVPFASSYKTVWTSIGIVAGWGLIVLGVSYYARNRIGTARWRKLHRFTALAWLLGLVHTLGEGSDAGQAWFLAMIGIVSVPPLALLAWRTVGGMRSSRPAQPAVSGAAAR